MVDRENYSSKIMTSHWLDFCKLFWLGYTGGLKGIAYIEIKMEPKFGFQYFKENLKNRYRVIQVHAEKKC